MAVFLKYFSLIFVAFMMLLPLVSCFVTAAKTDKEYQSTSVMDMPKNWFNFDNYVQAFVASNMAVAFRNSIIVVVVVLVVTTIIGTMLAYVLSRFSFPGNALIRTAFMMAALLPGIAMQVAVYKIMGSFHLINSLNVLDNVELPLLYRKVSAKERREAAVAVLEKVGLSHRMRHFPTQLSGGQCQRVAIARAIVGNPDIILADEPTGNLDSKMGAEVMELLHKLNKEDGRTIVMVTHNEEQARQTSRTVRFFDGRQVM